MRYNEISQSSRHHDLASAMRRSAAKLGLRSGWIDDARRAATPYVVECVGLSRKNLGDEEFVRGYRTRRLWCEGRCALDHEIEPIRNQNMVLIGYLYRFADEGDAALFKLLFC